MIVPGSNLLALALGVIGNQMVQWHKFAGLTTNAAGVQRPTWAAPVTINGSFQPADAATIQQLGLDWTRNYVNFFAPAEFKEIERDQSSDRVSYAGRMYQVVGKAAWYHQDGWERVLCVEVPADA